MTHKPYIFSLTCPRVFRNLNTLHYSNFHQTQSKWKLRLQSYMYCTLRSLRRFIKENKQKELPRPTNPCYAAAEHICVFHLNSTTQYQVMCSTFIASVLCWNGCVCTKKYLFIILWIILITSCLIEYWISYH